MKVQQTLTFAQWLQFIFIARMKMIAESSMALPDQISLSPMAEESFKGLGKKAEKLMILFSDIDALLTGSGNKILCDEQDD